MFERPPRRLCSRPAGTISRRIQSRAASAHASNSPAMAFRLFLCSLRMRINRPQRWLIEATGESSLNESLLAWGNYCAIDADRFAWLFTFSRGLVDRVSNLHPFSYTTESRKLTVQVMTRADQNEEVSRSAVRFFRTGHGNDPANVLYQTRFIRKFARHSLRQSMSPLFAGRKISTLNHKSFNYTPKCCGVQRPCCGQVQKVTDTFRRDFRNHFDIDYASLSFKRDALVPHLLNCGAIKWLGGIECNLSGPVVCFFRGLSWRDGCRHLSAHQSESAKHHNRR